MIEAAPAIGARKLVSDEDAAFRRAFVGRGDEAVCGLELVRQFATGDGIVPTLLAFRRQDQIL